MPPIQIEVDGVSRLLQELDPHEASDPDGISARFLKETASMQYCTSSGLDI